MHRKPEEVLFKNTGRSKQTWPFPPHFVTATPRHTPGLHSAGAAAGAFVLPYVPAGSAGLSPHPVPLLGGFPQAEVPLSTAAEGDEGSPQGASVLVWTVGISPQPAEARGRREQ